MSKFVRDYAKKKVEADPDHGRPRSYSREILSQADMDVLRGELTRETIEIIETANGTSAWCGTCVMNNVLYCTVLL